MFLLPSPVQRALSLLQEHGYEAYLVGGCVRDMLMKKVPDDYDITTNALPNETEYVFRDYKVIETGLRHGTVTVVINSEHLEITSYRTESGYSDNRRPDSVSFSKNLSDDLKRRDFTMNAVAYCEREGLIDLYDGVGDISLGLIRSVGNPDRRFSEDALRILRALRFSSVLGFKIESETSLAAHRNCSLLKNISAERVTAELTKILCGKNAGVILREYADVISIPIPELRQMMGFEQHNEHHCFDVWEHSVAVVENSSPLPALRWAALLHDVGKPSCFTLDENGVGHFYSHAAASKEFASSITKRLKFDNATREKVLMLISHHDTPIPPNKATVKRYLNRFGAESFSLLLKLHRADNLGQAPEYLYRQAEYSNIEAMLKQVIEEKSCFSFKNLAINGRDVAAAGYRGKEIGDELNVILSSVIDGKLPNERDILLENLQRRFPAI